MRPNTPRTNFLSPQLFSHPQRVFFHPLQLNLHTPQVNAHALQLNFRTRQPNSHPLQVNSHALRVFSTHSTATSPANSQTTAPAHGFRRMTSYSLPLLTIKSTMKYWKLTTDGRQFTARGCCINLLPCKTCVRLTSVRHSPAGTSAREIKPPVRTAETLCPLPIFCQEIYRGSSHHIS